VKTQIFVYLASSLHVDKLEVIRLKTAVIPSHTCLPQRLITGWGDWFAVWQPQRRKCHGLPWDTSLSSALGEP